MKSQLEQKIMQKERDRVPKDKYLNFRTYSEVCEMIQEMSLAQRRDKTSMVEYIIRDAYEQFQAKK